VWIAVERELHRCDRSTAERFDAHHLRHPAPIQFGAHHVSDAKRRTEGVVVEHVQVVPAVHGLGTQALAGRNRALIVWDEGHADLRAGVRVRVVHHAVSLAPTTDIKVFPPG